MGLQNHLDLMLSTELFGGFSRHNLNKLFDHHNYKIKRYRKNQVIHFENELCRSMDMVLAGRLSVQKINEEGNVLKVAEFDAGDTLGANLLFATSNLYPLTVVAESEAIVLHIYRELVLNLTQQSLDFTAALLAEISNKALILTGKIDTLSLTTIRERIISFLRYQHHQQKSDVIHLGMSKKELAERFGVQRTSLSRELNKMRRDGLIEYDAKTITIKKLNGI
ncbi:MAG: Crp/Fnr family transcriptional regulator [Firmicutes bacterium]|nr:Crp/Fnr family transcriptional regulator [Bacillota bacterium]